MSSWGKENEKICVRGSKKEEEEWRKGQDDAYREDCVSSLEGGITIDVLKKSVGKRREMSGEMQYQSAE